MFNNSKDYGDIGEDLVLIGLPMRYAPKISCRETFQCTGFQDITKWSWL